MNKLAEWQKVKEEYTRAVRLYGTEQEVVDAADSEIAYELIEMWRELFGGGSVTVYEWQVNEIRETLV